MYDRGKLDSLRPRSKHAHHAPFHSARFYRKILLQDYTGGIYLLDFVQPTLVNLTASVVSINPAFRKR